MVPYLFGETYTLECWPIYTTPLNEPLVDQPLIASSVFGIFEQLYYWQKRLSGLFLLLGLCLWTIGSSLLTYTLQFRKNKKINQNNMKNVM